MNDEYFDNLENLFRRYVDLDDFKKNYIDVKNPKNSEGLIDQFIRFNQDPLVWKYCRFNDSSDTLKITLKDNYKISDILEFARHYDLSKYKRIIITLKNIDYENIESLERLNKDVYINLYGNQGICTIDQFKNMRSFLNQFKDQYSSYNLSPLELITLAYDFTKFYLYNSGGNKNLYSSRVITKVIESGYIVCVGYCKLFCQLLEEFGIEANMLLTKSKERKDELGHARVLIQINDDKYNVSGIYVFDPTWDSERNMVLVEGNDKKLRYKKSSDILGSDRIIEKMPSTM